MKRWGKGLVILLWITLAISGAISAQSGESENLIANGDFSRGKWGWTVDDPCTNCWIKVRHNEAYGQQFLVWERTASHGAGSTINLYQDVNLDMSAYSGLRLGLDVRVDNHTLSNSGRWSDENNGSGEYPVKITLSFTDAAGNPFEWAYGFLSSHDDTTALGNYFIVPAGEWTSMETDLFSPRQWVNPRGEPLPKPATLTRITVGGSGWDFGGAVGSLELIGTFGTPPAGDGDMSLVVEEYPIVEASEDTPDHFEFKDRIDPAILTYRRQWRTPDLSLAADVTNSVIRSSGYALETRDDHYILTYNNTRLVLDIMNIWPAAVSASGDDFRLLVNSASQGVLVVMPDTVGQVNVSQFIYIAPVFVGEDLYEVEMSEDYTLFFVKRNGETVYTYTPDGPWVEPPIRSLWSWDGHWLIEAEGEVLIDGESMNGQLGYDEIFAWQLIAGQPFYFFRQGDEIRMSYAGETLDYRYDEVVHYMCCEPSMFNINGNNSLVWFYALRDGTWYYVEAGIYGE